MAYQVLMTVATVEIVKDLPRDTYGLIFGANLFVALGLQVITIDTSKLSVFSQICVFI